LNIDGEKKSNENLKENKYFKDKKTKNKKKFNIFKSLLMIIFMFISPVVVVIELFKHQKDVSRKWIISFICLLTLCVVLTWTSSALVDNLSKDAISILGNYSNYRLDIKNVPLSKQISYAALQNDLDAVLVSSIIGQQSGFEIEKISASGAKGIMQLPPNMWQQLNPDYECDGEHMAPACSSECIFDVEQNLDAGCRYFRYLINAYEGDIMLAVAAYSSGLQIDISISEDDMIVLDDQIGHEVDYKVIDQPNSIEYGYTQGILQSWINNRSKTLEERISLVVMARTFRTSMSIVTAILTIILLLWSILKYNKGNEHFNTAKNRETNNVNDNEDYTEI